VRGSPDPAQGSTPLLRGLPDFSTEWRSDLLGGVTVIKGTWSDGTPLVVVPNYVRNNRNADLTRIARFTMLAYGGNHEFQDVCV
jgi:hypothetical protein